MQRTNRNREKETQEDKLERLKDQLQRTNSNRETETEEVRAKRLEEQLQRTNENREIETPEEREKRLENQWLRTLERRVQESVEEVTSRLLSQRERTQRNRQNRTPAEESAALAEQRQRSERTRQNWTQEERTANATTKATQKRMKRENKRAMQQEVLESLAVKDLDITDEELKSKLLLSKENRGLFEEGREPMFEDANHSLPKAILQFHINSGHLRYDQFKEYGTQWNGKKLDTAALMEEIMEDTVSNDDMREIIARFEKVHKATGGDLKSCCSCGTRDYEITECSESGKDVVKIKTFIFFIKKISKYCK